MQTYNIRYKNKNDLEKFIAKYPDIANKEVLIQVFTSVHTKFQVDELVMHIYDVLPKAHILGTSTSFSIFQSQIIENSCVLSLTVFENTNISVYSIEANESINHFDLGKRMADQLTKGNEKVAITFFDSAVINPEKFLDGFTESKPEITVSGGIASGKNDKLFIFTSQGIISKGCIMAVLENPSLIVYNDFNLGWSSIGKRHLVTKAEGNIIETINHEPAQLWYEKYLGQKHILNKSDVGAQFPLMIKRYNQCVPKPILGFTNNGGMITGMGVKQGEEVRLGYGDLNGIIKESLRICSHIKKQPIQSLFIYACNARKTYLKDYATFEVNSFDKSVEASGFYSFGEIVTKGHTSMFLTESTVILGLSEEKESFINVDTSFWEELQKHQGNEQVILDHLINSTSDELDVLNQSLELQVKEQTEKLKQVYYRDELTNLNNMNRLKRDLHKEKFDKLALIDIEDFSNINNFYGSQVGNLVLRKFADYLKKELDGLNLQVFRAFSDTFAIGADESIKDYEFIDLIRALQNKISKKSFSIDIHDLYFNILVSITIKEEQLLEKASLTLNYLKTNNKTVQVYHPILKIEDEIEKNIKWVKKIKEAIYDDRIVPFFQPIYNNLTGEIDKYEALIRLIEEDGQVVPPGAFLTIAKKTNLYPALTKIMIEKTFTLMQGQTFEISINLTVDDLLDRETRNYIVTKLSRLKYPQNVIFEIVETEGIVNFKEVREFINQVKAFGAKIAIDDFGTGYSNLSYLIQLEVDIIKVDGSIIKHIVYDETSKLILETILHLTKRLGVKTVAEFVEDELIFHKVKELGIDYSQGYYFSKPLEQIEIIA
jgi:diguanylate cyclase (GGDEF)-like protein